MGKIKNGRKHSAHFNLNIAAAVLAVVAIVAYIVGAAVFGYYDDLNVMILAIAIAAAAAAVLTAILPEKHGDKTLYSILGIAVTVLLVVCAMLIAEARVYSIGVLLFSELERDNTEGYYALYCSLAAMGAFLAAMVCNTAGSFCSVKAPEQ